MDYPDHNPFISEEDEAAEAAHYAHYDFLERQAVLEKATELEMCLCDARANLLYIENLLDRPEFSDTKLKRSVMADNYSTAYRYYLDAKLICTEYNRYLWQHDVSEIYSELCQDAALFGFSM